jgi:hypothetical protein
MAELGQIGDLGAGLNNQGLAAILLESGCELDDYILSV